jgi:sulfatase maturation enzyme AslB (radical SAM superfamily)
MRKQLSSIARKLNARRGRGVYKSCAWIEEKAFVDGRTAKMCCIRNMGNDIVPTLFEIGDPREAAQKLLENKRSLRIANQTDKSPCHGCFLLKEQEWQARDYLSGIAISGFMHCNLACTYCVTYHYDPTDRGVPTLETLRAWHDIGMIRSGSCIEFGGGEPTLHREFDQIAAFAFERGIKMRVYTNAVGVSKSLLEGLRKGLAHLVISVDAGTPETYRRIKKKDVLHRVWDSIKTYAAIAPDEVLVKYIVMDSNRSKSELDAFFEQARRAGAKTFMPSVNVFQNQQSSGELSAPVKRAIAYLLKHGRSIGEAWLAETISPATRAEIEALASQTGDSLMPAAAGLNWRGQLELAFSESAVFHERARSIIAERDPFVIQFASPIESILSSQILQSAADDATAAGAVLSEVNDASGRLIGVEVAF